MIAVIDHLLETDIQDLRSLLDDQAEEIDVARAIVADIDQSQAEPG